MGSLKTRSAFAAALCAGVAMVGASVHGLLGGGAALQRSARGAPPHTNEQHPGRGDAPRPDSSDCPGGAQKPSSSHLS